MKQSILDYEMGDIQVHAPGYRDNPSIHTRIKQPERILRQLKKTGFKASARLLASGLAAANDSSAGVSLRGIEIKRDSNVSRINQSMYRGSWLDAKNDNGVVIGFRLARVLDVDLDDEIVVLSQGADGSFANELYRIRGILNIVSDGIDRTGIFLTAGSFRKLMVMPEDAHRIIIRKPTHMPISRAYQITKAIVPGLDVKTWRQLSPILASMLDSVQILAYAMFIIVYAAIGIVILNATLMAVFERIREFGVLKALGMGPGSVFFLITVEAFIQAGLSVLIGGLCAFPTLVYLTTKGIDLGDMSGMTVVGVPLDSVMRASITPYVYLGPVITLILMIIIAVLYPALKASLIKPIQAMVYH